MSVGFNEQGFEFEFVGSMSCNYFGRSIVVNVDIIFWRFSGRFIVIVKDQQFYNWKEKKELVYCNGFFYY